MEIKVSSTKETEQLANEIAHRIKPGNVIALNGDLGAGKTYFTRCLIKSLGFSDRVQSPTFVLIRKYVKQLSDSNPIKEINHIDLYRLTSIEQVIDLGFEEIINSPEAVSVIEWPDIANSIMPVDTIKIAISIRDGEERDFSVHNLY